MVDDSIFIDRNPKIFSYVLDYLANGLVDFTSDKSIKSLIKAELKYWGLKVRPEINEKLKIMLISEP